MAGKEATKEVKAAERFIISPAFDADTFAKIKELAERDERSMAQYLARYVREKLKDVKVSDQGSNVKVMSTNAGT